MKNSQTISNELTELKLQREEIQNRIGITEKELEQALKDESSGLNFVDSFIEKANAGRENLPNPFTGGNAK